MSEYIIGVDVGGTKVGTCITDLEGNIISRDKRPTEAFLGTERILENIYESILKVNTDTSTEGKDIAAIGICMPGHVNPVTGMAVRAANLKWSNVPVRDYFEEKLNARVFIENDVRAAAVGEHLLGSARGIDDFIYITIGTGIAAGIVANGSVIRGQDFYAGELGHTLAVKDGPLCPCGKRGCLETLVSGPSIARRAKEKLNMGTGSIMLDLAGGDVGNVTSEIVFMASSLGDGLARSIFIETCRYLGEAISSLINILNPGAVIIGGGLSRAGEEFFTEIKLVVDQNVPAGSRTVNIMPSCFYDEAGMMGSVAIAMKGVRIK